MKDILLLTVCILKEKQAILTLPGKMIDSLVRCHCLQQMGLWVNPCPQQVKVRDVWMNLENRKNLKYSAGNVNSTKLNTVKYSIIRLSPTTLKLREDIENLHGKTIFSVTVTILDMTFFYVVDILIRQTEK